MTNKGTTAKGLDPRAEAGVLPPIKLKRIKRGPEDYIDPKAPLKPAHERFCQLYAGNSQYFDDAARSYAVAYGYEIPTAEREHFRDHHGAAADLAMQEKARVMNRYYVAAHTLLRNPKIQARCHEVLTSLMTDEHMDAELTWLAKQRDNPTAKLGAIKEFNELKGRIQKKIKFSGNVGNYEIDADEAKELDDILEKNV